MISLVEDFTISLLTMINGTLIQDVGGRKILEPFVVAL